MDKKRLKTQWDELANIKSLLEDIRLGIDELESGDASKINRAVANFFIGECTEKCMSAYTAFSATLDIINDSGLYTDHILIATLRRMFLISYKEITGEYWCPDGWKVFDGSVNSHPEFDDWKIEYQVVTLLKCSFSAYTCEYGNWAIANKLGTDEHPEVTYVDPLPGDLYRIAHEYNHGDWEDGKYYGGLNYGWVNGLFW